MTAPGLGPDPRTMSRSGLEEEVARLRTLVRQYQRRNAASDEQIRQDMARGVRCPCCGGPDPITPFDVCAPCATAYGWPVRNPAGGR